MLNTSRPSIPRGHVGEGGGGVRGSQSKTSIGKLSNGWTDWHRIWYTSVDSSRNGHRLKTIRPTIPQCDILGGFMGLTSQKTGKCGQTAGPIENQVCVYNADESGNGHRLNKLATWHTKGSILTWGQVGVIFWGLGGLIFHQKSGKCHDIQRKQIKINFLKRKCTNIYHFAATIPGEAG